MFDFRQHISNVLGVGDFDPRAITEKIHLRPTDILLLSGSLVEGTGTPTSDFDFCIVSDEPDDRFRSGTFPHCAHMRFYTSGERVTASFDYLRDSLLGVDVEYRTGAEIREAIERHRTLYEHLRQRARKSSSFGSTGVDYRLLSRLSYAVPLQNAEKFAQLTADLNVEQICYAAFRTSVGSFPDFRDITGAWIQQDYATALALVRKLAGDHVRGLTHMHGNTNRNPKYLSRYVQRLPPRFASFIAEFHKLYEDDVRQAGSPKDAVLRWLDLVDDVYGWIRRERDQFTAFPTRADFLAALRRELHSEMEWHGEIDREYAFRAREVIDGLPRLADMIRDTPGIRSGEAGLPFRAWAAQNTDVPRGENNNAFKP